MSWEGILVGGLAILIGLGFTFVGYRFFLILLPIWGFLVGFAIGANAVASLFGEGFLATITGWGIGFILALVCAVLAYLFWYAAVVILAGSVGYALGGSLLGAIGIDASWLVFLAGLALGAVFLIGALVLNVPRYVIVVLTGIGGAAGLVLGAALIIGRVPVDALGDAGLLSAVIRDSWLWAGAWAVLAIAGMVVQLRTFPEFLIDRKGYRDASYMMVSR
jgi:hypothetical protein